MSEFARSLFGFAKTKQVQQQNTIRPSSPPPDFPLKMMPHTASPTIALSDNSFATGTTIKGERGEIKTHLDRQASGMSSGRQHSQLTAQLHHGEKAGANSRDSEGSEGSTGRESEGTLGSEKTVKTLSAESAGEEKQAGGTARIPRGKLRVTVDRAVDLNVMVENSRPYVVCTFENSEFVTGFPYSFDTARQSIPEEEGAINQQMKHQQVIRPPFNRQSSSSRSLNIRPGSMHSRNPVWKESSIFDVIGQNSEIEVSVYDASQDDFFLGHARIRPRTDAENKTEGWYSLRSRISSEMVTGRVQIRFEYTKIGKHHYSPQDFEILRLLGKGTFGQVFQVKKKDSGRVYAMKVLSKKAIVKKKEVAHTIGERDILVTTSTSDSAFIVGLKFSFQTPTDLYLVTDFMSGGELFWHLQKEGRFSEDRARFYIAELVLALQHLHDNGIVYRDLKPENILLDANGHIALCDFGLSKANLSANGTTNTFCGTTEYLAPEVLLDESGYTKMVDFWSLGVLIFEMCCGWSPFYAENTQQMYKNIAFGKVRFPKEVLSPEGRSFVKGLLNRNPKHRLGALQDARELMAHPFFRDVDWNLLHDKKIPPPFVPHIANELDTSNFDPEFTNASTSAINRQFIMGSTPLPTAMQDKFKGFTYVDDSTMFDHLSNLSVKRGNSLKPQYGSLIPGNPNLPPDEEVIEDDSDLDESNDDRRDGANEDEMDIDDDDEDEFVNGPFDL